MNCDVLETQQITVSSKKNATAPAVPSEEFEFYSLPRSDIGSERPPQTVETIEIETFKLVEMARRWVAEHEYPPYKLALQANISTSQCHKMMAPTWNPSIKLLRKIASALPRDWVVNFERDANWALPREVAIPQSVNYDAGLVDGVIQALKNQDFVDAARLANSAKVSVRQLDLSRKEYLDVRHFHSTHSREITKKTGITPLAASPSYPPHPIFDENSIYYYTQRKPVRYLGNYYRSILDCAFFSDDGYAFQFWKIVSIDPFQNTRQSDILDTYIESTDILYLN